MTESLPVNFGDTRLPEKFWRLVAKSDGCWEWIGVRQKRGYGVYCAGGRANQAHRFLWTAINGSVSSRIVICHHCDNTPCVRPSHLFAGTQSENLFDAGRKGRLAVQVRPERNPFARMKFVGDKNPASKLNIESVRAIRGATGSNRALGEKYGVAASTIGHVRNRDLWSWVE